MPLTELGERSLIVALEPWLTGHARFVALCAGEREVEGPGFRRCERQRLRWSAGRASVRFGPCTAGSWQITGLALLRSRDEPLSAAVATVPLQVPVLVSPGQFYETTLTLRPEVTAWRQ